MPLHNGVSPLLNQVPLHNIVWGSAGIASRICNLGPRLHIYLMNYKVKGKYASPSVISVHLSSTCSRAVSERLY
jgi:hypothetical protein